MVNIFLEFNSSLFLLLINLLYNFDSYIKLIVYNVSIISEWVHCELYYSLLVWIDIYNFSLRILLMVIL